jgi:hypothetical protein
MGRSALACPKIACPRIVAVLPLLLLASACDRQAASSQQSSPAPTPAAATPTPAPLDVGALDERQNPDRVLRYYGAALAAGDWQAASRAWGAQSGVSGITLQAEYGAKGPVTLLPGKGTGEGACGSLYYEAPVTLRFDESGEERTGTITLRRVNDVEGAAPDQLRWHIEGSTVGPAQ